MKVIANLIGSPVWEGEEADEENMYQVLPEGKTNPFVGISYLISLHSDEMKPENQWTFI